MERNYTWLLFPDIVKDCLKMRNLPTIFLRSFENALPGDRLKTVLLSQVGSQEQI